MTRTLMTAIQPSDKGAPHLGNLLGALLPFKKHAENASDDTQVILMVASLHATTTGHHDPENLFHARRSTIAALQALDIKHKNLTIVDQADLTALPLFTSLLSHCASMGPLSLMTQFKNKNEGIKNSEIPLGLFTYPVMMAADILALGGTHIPVGDDQEQHLQFTRELAKRCNKRFHTKFKIPQAVLSPTPRIMDLRVPTRKMSKSTPEGAIFLGARCDDIARQIKRATSDSDKIPKTREETENKPYLTNFYNILQALTNTSYDELIHHYGGQNCSFLKKDVTEVLINFLKPLSQRYHDHLKQHTPLDALTDAHLISEIHAHELKKAMGLGLSSPYAKEGSKLRKKAKISE